MLSAVFIIITCSSRAKIDIYYLSYTCRRWDTFPAEGRSAGNVQSPTDRKFQFGPFTFFAGRHEAGPVDSAPSLCSDLPGEVLADQWLWRGGLGPRQRGMHECISCSLVLVLALLFLFIVPIAILIPKFKTVTCRLHYFVQGFI